MFSDHKLSLNFFIYRRLVKREGDAVSVLSLTNEPSIQQNKSTVVLPKSG